VGAKVLATDLKQRLTFDICDTWQARLLTEARGLTRAVVLSVLAHNFDDAMPALLETVFPGFRSITAPFLCSAGRVSKSGTIVANVVMKDGRIVKDYTLYSNEIGLRDDFRKMADRLTLNDRDRVELFAAVKRWVVADRRLDPTMDPKDPDAKRLVH
jgi:hypothetical protein